MPLEVFGQTLYFMVDTGCTLSLLDQRYANRLAAPVNRYLAATPISGGTDLLTTYRSPEMLLAGRELGLKEISTTDLRMARWVSGQPCDGILGLDFFANAIVSMDFDNRLFTLGNSLPAASRFTRLPLQRLTPHWTARGLLNGRHALDLLIDTGDSSSLSLNGSDWDTVFAAG